MMIEDRTMRGVGLVALTFLIACTRPNPRDCADGLCSDPAYPFCDVDGALEGEPKACIAVACTAGEFRACRGDVSLVCNATGNDYDLVACERGCDPTHGCRACTTAEDCANPEPVCDTDANACRACNVDDECTSNVCDQGSCMNEAGILYVKANGSDSSDCSHQQPCSLYRAINLALAASPGPTIRLLPGLYASPITVSTANPVPLKFVGTGASLAAQTAISVQDGAQVDIRGISAAGTSTSVHCASTTTTRSSLTLRDAHITAGGGGATLMYLEKCTLEMTGGELDIGASTGVSVQMLADVAFSADRVHVHGTRVSQIGASLATRIAVKVTNSLLEDVSFQWQTNDTSFPGSSVSMGFNTMMLKNQLNCATNSGSAYRKSTYENNIIVSIDPTSAVNGTDCTLGHNLLFPYNGTAGTNIVADPQFQDAANGDFRLQATSPAVDAAVPSSLLPATTDYAGTSRPQGAKSDIGAFERTP